MRKSIKLLVICILASILTTLVSCKKDNSDVSNVDNTQGKITIVTDENHEQSLRFAAESFKKLHDKVDISLKVEDDYYNKFEQSVKNKDNSVDIISMDGAHVQYYLDKFPNVFLNVTQDLDNYKSKISRSKIDNLTWKNKIYGFPWSVSPKVILCRNDILTSEGFNINDIKTWGDYIEVGKKITKDTGKKMLANVEDENNDIYLLLGNQLEISYFDKENKSNFNSKEWTKVIETIKNLYLQNIIYDVNSKQDVIKEAQNGEIVSFIADPYYISYFMNKVPDQKGKWSAIKLPAFEPGGNRDVSLGGYNLMINSISKNKKLAKDFVKYIITDENTSMENMKNQGVFSGNRDIYNLVEFNKQEDYYNGRVWSLLGNTEKGAYPIIYTPYFFAVRDSVKNELSQSNLKSKDIKIILDTIQKNVDKIITQNNNTK